MGRIHHIRILAGTLDRRAGSHAYHCELSTQLAKRGYRVSIVCFRKLSEIKDVFEIYEIQRVKPVKGFWRFVSVLDYLYCTVQIRNLDMDMPDVVISGEHLFMIGHARRFPTVPFIYLPHSLSVRYEIQSYGTQFLDGWIRIKLYKWLQRWGLNNAEYTLRFSHHACKLLSHEYGSKVHPNFIVNPPGVNVPALSKFGLVAHEVRLLSVGRLVLSKRIHVCLEVLHQLRHLRWRFDIVGDGEGRSSLEKLSHSLGLSDRVSFFGFQPEPWKWYMDANLLLFPSELESFGLSIIESMSYGVPVLAMQGDGIRYQNATSEIITNSVNGFLAKSDEHFKDQLQYLIKHPDALSKVGQIARDTVIRKYSWDKHIDKYEDIFYKMMAT